MRVSLFKFSGMKARLNITIEETLLEEAKIYALKNELSLSQIIEDYLTAIVKKPERPSLLDVLDSLPKVKSTFPDNFDFKKEYYEDRKTKYGF